MADQAPEDTRNEKNDKKVHALPIINAPADA
jgi:hypothetical protein